MSYTPTGTGLLTYFDTDTTKKKQYLVFGASVKYRIITYDMTRAVFDTKAHADSALNTYLSATTSDIRDGSSRRINDVGWAEVVFVSKSYGTWQTPSS